ncbi:MAG: HD domain-containing protein, partial [Nanoarchaeota archaeon]|nr:HD domain-containing protein [Nanoarchaeota archaeon]
MKMTKHLPVYNIPLDMAPYEPIVMHPLFTRLSRIQQVPLAEHLYPGCKHTREEHSLGSFYLAGRIADVLGLSTEDGEAVKIGALVHDIGHGPFSHITDYLLKRIGKDHNQKTVEIVKELRDSIQGLGNVDPDKVVEIVSKNHELSPIVSSIIGADKLDYVGLDLYHCDERKVSTRGLIELLKFRGSNGSREYGVSYSNGGEDALTNFLSEWWSAYKTIYFEPSVEIRREMFKRAVHYTISPERLIELFDMDDGQLMTRVNESGDEDARRLIENVNGYKLHQPVAVFKREGHKLYTDVGDSRAITITEDEIESLPSRIDDLLRKEEGLCEEFDVPKGSIILSQCEELQRLNPDKKRCNIFLDGS